MHIMMLTTNVPGRETACVQDVYCNLISLIFAFVCCSGSITSWCWPSRLVNQLISLYCYITHCKASLLLSPLLLTCIALALLGFCAFLYVANVHRLLFCVATKVPYDGTWSFPILSLAEFCTFLVACLTVVKPCFRLQVWGSVLMFQRTLGLFCKSWLIL